MNTRTGLNSDFAVGFVSAVVLGAVLLFAVQGGQWIAANAQVAALVEFITKPRFSIIDFVGSLVVVLLVIAMVVRGPRL